MAATPARRSSRLATAASSTPASPKRKPTSASTPKSAPKKASSSSKSWADSAGVGDRRGAWGIDGGAGFVLQYAGAFLLLTCCPAVVIYL